MPQPPVLIDVNLSNRDSLPCCGIKSPAHPGVVAKRRWLKQHLTLGLKARILIDDDGKPCGYIESIPGEYAWRAVDARGYLFIHCIWNHSKRNRDKGWGSAMIQSCLHVAKAAGMNGVAVMTREGPWSAGAALFDANGFKLVDTAEPDCLLWVRKLKPRAANPSFTRKCSESSARLKDKLTIVTAAQCPYAVKFTTEIRGAAQNLYSIEPRMLQLTTHRDAQNAPTPFAVFSVVFEGRVLADHPISRTRFCNIMRSLQAPELRSRIPDRT
jgi:hypothetical protein